MENLKLVFADSDNVFGNIIKLLTWSQFCHVGILCDKTVIDSRYLSKGVRETSLEEFYKLYKVVMVKELAVPAQPVIDAARTQIGKPYDWTAVLGIPFRRNWQEDDSWFCSELVAWAAKQVGSPIINKDLWRVTPQDLWQLPSVNDTIIPIV